MQGRKWAAIVSGRGAAMLLVQVEKKVATTTTVAWAVGGVVEEQRSRWQHQARGSRVWLEQQQRRKQGEGAAAGERWEEVKDGTTTIEEGMVVAEAAAVEGRRGSDIDVWVD
ncbi:hypothetical protein B296_00038087 [Ensete ventricosum]|uniref:Uncharacterized protein n=1 Tax=Ensete ventricosum TaxID=4639 RepID=A0A426ZKW2_ENSVE|nr:hypothetical protein B296_00038087 [Ensete ventricosum]